MATKQPLRPGRLGHDFLPFYTAACFVRDGRAAELYDLDAIRAAEHATAVKFNLDLGDAVGPFWNPPFYAIFLAPLSFLPYPAALLAWTLLNAAAVLMSVSLLCRMLRPIEPPEWKAWLLVPLIVCTSAPSLLAFTHGQNTGLSLLLLTLAATAWRAGRGVWAGVCVGLLGYKPQLAALAAAVLVIDLGRRAILGLVLSGGSLLLLNIVALPGTLQNYVQRLTFILNYMQVERPYIWERHATMRAFWRLLIQGRSAGQANPTVQALAGASVLAVLIALAFALRRSHLSMRRAPASPSSASAGEGRVVAEGSARRQPPLTPHSPSAPTPALPRNAGGGRTTRDRLIASTILAMPLVMPFYFDYDLLLLPVPAVLLAAEGKASRLLVSAWVALHLWLTINPDIAELTRVNLAVPLLAFIALTTIHGVGRQTQPSTTDAQNDGVSLIGRIAFRRASHD